MDARTSRALSYTARVRECRTRRAAWVLTVIEIILVVYSICLAVAIHTGGGPL